MHEKNIINLDTRDKKILYQLDINCRQSNAEIGRKVRCSKQVVDYRIKKLVAQGVIDWFGMVVDTYKLGYSKYKIYIRYHNASQQKKDEIIAYFTNHPSTEWVASCSGAWDIIVGFLVKGKYSFHKILKEILNKFSGYIAQKETTIAIYAPHSRKEFLVNHEQCTLPWVIQGGEPLSIFLDKTDEEIIKWLVNNARMPITELAQRVGASARTVAYRIKELTEKEILLLPRIFINLNSINYVFCKSLLYFKDVSDKRMKSFMKYCELHPPITYVIECIGPWEIELEFEIESFEKFIHEMQQIMNLFGDIITKYDFVVALNVHKLDYYPGSYPKIMLL